MPRRALILFIPQIRLLLSHVSALIFASLASNQGEIEITGSQSDLINIDENQSPVSEGLQYCKPPKRTSLKKKQTEPKGKTGHKNISISAVSRIELEPSFQRGSKR